MRFEVYCDEAFPDLFTSGNPKAQFLMIGSLWLPAEMREEVKAKIKTVRERHGAWGEIKWSKVSPSQLGFYLDLLELFFGYGDNLRFRCIAVDREQVNLALHEGDHELGFYKFYYQVLHHWILDFNSYSIFCDTKSNRERDRLHELGRVLDNANLSSSIESVQALPSKQVVLIQMADLLLGAASSRMNGTLREGSAKEHLVLALEQRLGHKLRPTMRSARKFNIFKINLGGGW
ncbi:DUF3800 domain-containing protein [Salipiger bermudensis]|uniref:DUF3800 domain-containing protein n=1 Tax=Salipiger bermudensis TaxID=344736 RepID=UPI001CD733D6|nr:DUF3800 domain-containing protein [Salipiger bermudensis]MCA1287910.1 DUF3800 domain-containing protein [Salipiger bermudensis]